MYWQDEAESHFSFAISVLGRRYVELRGSRRIASKSSSTKDDCFFFCEESTAKCSARDGITTEVAASEGAASDPESVPKWNDEGKANSIQAHSFGGGLLKQI